MNALVVGGGSVGQVIARHLHAAGSRVTLLVRSPPGARSDVLVMYPLNARNARSKPVRFSSFELLIQSAAARAETWDQIYFCIPSNGLTNDLIGGLQAHSGTATIVKLQAGLRDRLAYTAHFDESHLVTGMLSLISYQAPLPGETVPAPGTAYWFPPLLPSLFSGPAPRAREVIGTLRAGGFPAREQRDVERLVGYVLAAEAPLTAGLECAGWSIQAFIRGRWFAVACRAIQEAGAVVKAYQGSRPPALTRLIGRATLRLAIALFPKHRPIPLEAYLQHHFTKLSAQSRRHLGEYIDEGGQRSLPVGSLIELRQGLIPSDPAA